jgi:type III restriction enzyme
MAMKQVVIENPVINSPFDEPQRHFLFTNEGITNEIVPERRVSSYFIPIAKPKKKGEAGLSARYRMDPGARQTK